jgi:hypothetical protein
MRSSNKNERRHTCASLQKTGDGSNGNGTGLSSCQLLNVPQCGRANRKSFEVEVANADFCILSLSLGYIAKVLYNSTRDDYCHS